MQYQITACFALFLTSVFTGVAPAQTLSALQSASPNVTYPATVPAETPTNIGINDGQGKLNPAFGYVASVPTTYSPHFPDNYAETWRATPGLIGGTGNMTIEFVSNAAALTVSYKQLGGAVRISADGLEVSRVVPVAAAGTVSGSSAAGLTLEPSSSGSDHFYDEQYVTISSGQGSGQSRLITDYDGATKTAVLAQRWAVLPDAASTYVIAKAQRIVHSMPSDGRTGLVTLIWSGRQAVHRYRIELNGTPFYGVSVSNSTDWVDPTSKSTRTPCFWMGDSYSEGTGADAQFDGLANRACALLGWDCWNLSVGGTGYLNPANGGLAFPDRAMPPANAWLVSWNGGTGEITYKQGKAVTAGLTLSSSREEVQAEFDRTFGVGAFSIAGGPGTWFILGRGANADKAAPLTISTRNLSGIASIPTAAHYDGDIAPWLPKDAEGHPLPFVMVWAGGHNDTVYSGTAYTPARLQAAASKLYTDFGAKYPMATQIVVGMMNVSGENDGWVIAADRALQSAAAGGSSRLSSRSPLRFIETEGNLPGTQPWITGTGSVLAPAGDGNADYFADLDHIHPSLFGHINYGQHLAQEMLGADTDN